MKTPLIIAHRGDSGKAPENTLASFESAINKGADTVELDVHLSADKQVVIHHDYYLERTTNGAGFIGSKSLSELKMLDAGSWFDKKFSHERIPTLEEVCDLGKGKIRFEIELKSPYIQLIKNTLTIVESFGLLADVEFTSWHVPLLFHIKLKSPKSTLGMIFNTLPDWMEPSLGIAHVIGLMNLADAQIAHIYPDMLESKNVARVQNAGYKVSASSNEQKENFADCMRSGADQISTNYLDLALTTKAKHVS